MTNPNDDALTAQFKSSDEALSDLQKVYDELKATSEFGQYAKTGRLSLLDSKFEIIDRLVKLGVLK